MTPQDIVFDPYKFATQLIAAQVGLAKDAQTLFLRQLDAIGRDGLPLKVKMMETPVPVPMVTMEMNETRMREVFHAMADANLASWARMADVVSAMPGWAKWLNRAPGEFWTGVFDRYSTLDAGRPANDVRAEMRAAAEEVMKSAGDMAASAARKPDLKVAAAKSPVPTFLKKPNGKADDLTAIKGIGPKLSATLNELGVFHYAQIAEWTPEQCDWIDDKLAFKGRVQREGWVEQAGELARKAA
jgi:predicted flap endonuclease-1-like 5' DNA nuclease